MPFTVRHLTVYRYAEPVRLGEHRMMFRPRESHDLRLLDARLDIQPRPTRLRWLHDVFDNSIAIATFDGSTAELRFDSRVTLEHVTITLPDYPLEASAHTYPFRYAADEVPNLARALAHHYPSEDVGRWVRQFLPPSGTIETMRLLRSITLAIKDAFVYTRRGRWGWPLDSSVAISLCPMWPRAAP